MIIDFFPFPFLIGLALLAAVVFRLRQKRHRLSYLITATLLGLYLLLLIDAVIFYIPASGDPGPILTIKQAKSTLSRVNLIPLNFGDPPNAHYLFDQIFYNILLTVPFGFGINFFVQFRLIKILWIAAAVGCATELSQLLVSLFIVGGAYRSVDINDVLLNMAGVWVGFAVYQLVKWRIPKVSRISREA